MWECAKCRETLEESFDTCWNCGTSRDGTEDPTFQRIEDLAEAAGVSAIRQRTEKSELRCMRCDRVLDYLGTKAFHEGTRWGILGEWSELFVNKERFDVYCCPKCGQVDFFLAGTAEDY